MSAIRAGAQLLDVLGDGIVAFDASGHATSCSEIASRVLGRPVSEIVGHTREHVLGLTVGVEAQGISVKIHDVSHLKEEVHTVLLLRAANESLLAERTSLAERVEDRTRALRDANAELERASRHKDEFLAAMSHELRTPLNAILGLTEAMQEGLFGPVTDAQGRSLSDIESSGRHLLAVINDILDLSKVMAGKREVNSAPVVLTDLANASVRMVRQLALKKRIDLQLDLSGLPDQIETDERLVKQILVNLLSNAVKFTSDSGVVRLDGTVDASRDQITLRVMDTGIGISPANLPRIFKPFEQIDGGLARRHAGTGLGLALVSRLSELLGGGVFVESTEGEGSRFSLTLPLSRSVATAVPSTPELEASRRVSVPGMRPVRTILLAEDNEANQRTFVGYLQAKGYTVAVAWNGEEAIEQTKALNPALILMDIQMPKMDGLTAIRRIREDPRFAQTPIVALTALAMPGDRERCLQAGANLHLTKPVRLRDLTSAIEGQFNGGDETQTAAGNL
ncbi:MAG: response regulator [Gemmatimonadetes bacterium]|nr:response regulator [Gemmatimonadota bacterium]